MPPRGQSLSTYQMLCMLFSRERSSLLRCCCCFFFLRDPIYKQFGPGAQVFPLIFPPKQFFPFPATLKLQVALFFPLSRSQPSRCPSASPLVAPLSAQSVSCDKYFSFTVRLKSKGRSFPLFRLFLLFFPSASHYPPLPSSPQYYADHLSPIRNFKTPHQTTSIVPLSPTIRPCCFLPPTVVSPLETSEFVLTPLKNPRSVITAPCLSPENFCVA